MKCVARLATIVAVILALTGGPVAAQEIAPTRPILPGFDETITLMPTLPGQDPTDVPGATRVRPGIHFLTIGNLQAQVGRGEGGTYNPIQGNYDPALAEKEGRDRFIEGILEIDRQAVNLHRELVNTIMGTADRAKRVHLQRLVSSLDMLNPTVIGMRSGETIEQTLDRYQTQLDAIKTAAAG